MVIMKFVYSDGEIVKILRGDLIEEDDNVFKVKSLKGDIVILGKKFLIRAAIEEVK